MIFNQKEPIAELTSIIKCFWKIESNNIQAPIKEKIIPDGYPELIFHYGDVFRSNINSHWETQGKTLVAGQIRNYFFLENTGVIGMFGIKFQPSALRLLFDFNMSNLTDQVKTIDDKTLAKIAPVIEIALSQKSFQTKVKGIERWFKSDLNKNTFKTHRGDISTQMILKNNGLVNLKNLKTQVDISGKSLERYYKSHIGLPAKYYCRIIRFAQIFKLVQEKDFNWLDIVSYAGYYDQSHFIKNFKEFTGDSPSEYGFTQKTIANFFLK